MLLRPLLLADNIAWRENLKPTEAWAGRYNSDFSLCVEYLHACVLLRTAFIIFAVLILACTGKAASLDRSSRIRLYRRL
jgi:hypothetical protein